MDAVEFVKAYRRMCKNMADCERCPVFNRDTKDCINRDYHSLDANTTVTVIEQWAKEHPVKTRQSKFLEMFPNASVEDDGSLTALPCNVDRTVKGSCETKKCRDCRRDYWLQEVE